MTCKDGNGIKVISSPQLAFSESANSLMVVFSKDEIVFARTSPKHKLEIGKCNSTKPLLQFSDTQKN